VGDLLQHRKNALLTHIKTLARRLPSGIFSAIYSKNSEQS